MKYSSLTPIKLYTDIIEVLTEHVRDINILTYTRGFPSQIAIFKSFFQSPGRNSQKGLGCIENTTKYRSLCWKPQVMLEYLYISNGAYWKVTSLWANNLSSRWTIPQRIEMKC